MPPDRIVSPELAAHLCELSRDLGRQIGVFVDRRGQLTKVFVGDANQLVLPDFGRVRAGRERFRGLRLVHTHLDDVQLTRDDLTDLALLRLDLVAALLQVEEGDPVEICYAHLSPSEQTTPYEVHGPQPLHQVQVDFTTLIGWLEQTFTRERTVAVGGELEPTILVCATRTSARQAEDRIDELRELAATAGLEILEVVHQRRAKPDPKYLVGRGKLEEVVIRAMQLGVELLLFDPDLTPTQAKAIAAMTDLRVIDRCMLILDIFAQRASSRDGKLQVELAQLRYALPRLVGRGTMMSRLAGGIGGRGPGETKLEIDRRRARDRITQLERAIDQLAQRRVLSRKRRRKRQVPVVAIVGYTNAGKSTLLNTLTHSDVFTEDKLFATLDPTSRRVRFPRDRELLLTDTVGFIRELPETLATAFRATLEELAEADLMVHLVDASEPGAPERIDAVEQILGEMDLGNIARLTVYNKVDRLADKGSTLPNAQRGIFAISALDRQTCRPLLAAIEERLWRAEAN